MTGKYASPMTRRRTGVCEWRRTARRIGCAIAALAATGLVLWTPAAGAQEQAPPGTGPPGTTAPPAGAEQIIGVLATPAGPVRGARIDVAADGTAVGDTRTADDGSFAIRVPGPGRYEVRLDTATLPEGVRLAPQARDTLDNVLVFANREKRVAFDVIDGSAEPVAAGPTTTERLSDLTVSGTRYGLVIALCAVGLTLIYATTGLVNFAHGELVTFGALAAWFLSSSWALSLPLALATVLAFAIAIAFGLLQDVAIWQPLRRWRPGNITALVVSIGLAMALRNLYQVVFDSNPRPFFEYATQGPVSIGPLRVLPKDLVAIAVCLAALAATAVLLRWTRLGTAIRAVADEPDLARASGIGVRGVFVTVWGLGAGLAGLGGVMLALNQGVQWNLGTRILLVVFAAVVVGGFGSPTGALLGGLLIGVVSEVSTFWLPPEFKDVLALGALIVVLLARPQGILGLRERVG